jgi:MoxR-like ATPase
MEDQRPNTENLVESTSTDIQLLNEKIKKESAFVSLLTQEIGKVIIGQEHMVQRLLIGLLSNGHVLLEGVPGLAKTLAINTLSRAVNVEFSRIQFTPDLLPADLIGTMIYNQKKEDFTIKVQSALLEAMQERQITIGDETYKLPEPFLVLATQNPIEQEGTYPLPEAQVDRFMLKVVLDYPNKEHEKLIIRQNISSKPFPKPNAVINPDQILKAREVVREVYMDEKIEQYIVDIVGATRNPKENGLEELESLIEFGGSPRASINLALAAKAYAFINHRGYVIPEDVREICKDVLRHRIGLSYEAEAENITVSQIIDTILNKVQVP